MSKGKINVKLHYKGRGKPFQPDYLFVDLIDKTLDIKEPI